MKNYGTAKAMIDGGVGIFMGYAISSCNKFDTFQSIVTILLSMIVISILTIECCTIENIRKKEEK